ncbi:uncharacterized protein LOC119106304 [Pollicipes pollicipes]|uniref:uncharacterized protein LOC119106292 n=1 Tax=Pollicipes pollicipes TaxID=41117 RepID=UPI001884B5A6|nr:uncharacterized protein LOC119106292 [Pollicipes pollicipes]XP_037085815.1 uncharacterized protein LOC119106304 [Pollicipes pollicipes]
MATLRSGLLSLLLVSTLSGMLTGCAADIIENFENGMGSNWKTWSDDNGGHWLWRNASDLDMPQRPDGDSGVTMVFPNEGKDSAAAHLYSPLLTFPAGAKIKLSYWIRSMYIGAANLILKRVEGGQELNPFLDLSSYATPDNNEWRQAEADVPASQTTQSRICIFGFRRNHKLDAIAVDNLVLTGVDGSETSIPLHPAAV